MNNTEVKKMLTSLKEAMDTLNNSLPKEMPIKFCSSIDPLRAILLREACLYRIAELVESAYYAFLKNKLVTAFILCRAYMETEALFWGFVDILRETLESRDLTKIRSFLKKTLTGVKDKQLKEFKWPENAGELSDPIHVLKLIEDMGKKIQYYPVHYASVSEFSHPNAAGTVDAYVFLDWNANIARFGQNPKLHPDLALPQLVGSVETFIHIYNDSTLLFQRFTDLCELSQTQIKMSGQNNEI